MFTQNDTAPALTGTCLNGKTPANLTGATAVAHIQRPDRTILSRAVTLTDAANGAWSLAWQTGDLAQEGQHRVEVEVTYANTQRQTFGRQTFRVEAELA